jgi:glycosyltransferase involved in cell wall biosynthesis
VNLVWRGPLTDPSGFASQGRAFVRGLVEAGADLRVEHLVWHWREAVTPSERERLADLIDRPVVPADVHLQHTLARLFDPYAAGRLRIGRTAWEVDRVPADWVARARQMDEVWVPCRHNADAFVASGVEPDRVHVLPEPIELDRFAPGSAPALEVPGAHGTVFLASFDWSLRKGWDVLLRAWLRAFRVGDDVTLVLKTWSTRGLTDGDIQARLVAAIEGAGHDPERVADIVVLTELLDTRGVAGLYAACDVYVAPSRGEGFCRPVAEAMAAGRPVIATHHSGPADFTDEAVGWPLPWTAAEVSEEARAEALFPAGSRWAEPDVDALVDALRDAHARPDERLRRGVAARDRARGFDHLAIARRALARMAEVTPRASRPGVRAVRPGLPSVLLQGSVFGVHSLAGVNRELARALVRTGAVEVGVVDTEGARLDPAAPGLAALAPLVEGVLPHVDVTVRQAYPPNLDPGAPGRVAQFLHWEFGPLPRAWVRAQRDRIDEVWAASGWAADWMVRSGMDPARVATVPLGVDPDRFRPGLEPLDLGPVAPGFRFLFVGGLVWRKGIDVLLDAYRLAFTRSDDVTLVVKDFGAGGPYVPQEAADGLARLAADPGAGRVAHFTGALPEADMPRLYAACDCLVHPFRGEAFGLPIVEAMACGLPVVVPEGGPCLDYADAATALLVPCREVPTGWSAVGGMLLAGEATVLDTRVEDVAAAMRRAYEDPEGSRALGARAARRVRGGHTWDHTARAALARVGALRDRLRTAA